MFNNLVESGKHTDDFKRKGSFFLAITIAYSFFLVSAGVASVFAYDAHLENQSLELVSLLSPVPVDKPEPQKPQESKPVKSNEPKAATRTEFIDRADNPQKTPQTISSTASNTPPIPRSGNVVIGPTNTEGISTPNAPSYGNSNTNNTVGKNTPLVSEEQPPPSTKKKENPPEQPTTISKGVINGQAKYLHTPSYPMIAKNAGIKGEVKVQVLIDERGKVVSATVLSGHSLLSAVSKQAALQSVFSTTFLSNEPVKVSGIIVYNFK